MSWWTSSRTPTQASSTSAGCREQFDAGRPDRNLFVVGDDDQSIYGWRGAQVENILKFEKDHPGTRVIRLEQNYRSTQTILKAANGGHRSQHRPARQGAVDRRRGRASRSRSTPPSTSSTRRASWSTASRTGWRRPAARRGRHPVPLQRPVAGVRGDADQRRAFPTACTAACAFFERAEIKDALAYLRLIASRHDDPSFERVANVPTRGIGDRTVEAIREHARARTLSLWEAAADLIATGKLAARAANAVRGFLELIERLAAGTAG
jgi:DNA helicase II / ATP-dependent DNA helicase PcrA